MSPRSDRPLKVALVQSVGWMGQNTDQRYGRLKLPMIADYVPTEFRLNFSRIDTAAWGLRRVLGKFGIYSRDRVFVVRGAPIGDADVAFAFGIRPWRKPRCPLVYWETFFPSNPPYVHTEASRAALREKHAPAIQWASKIMTPLEHSAEEFRKAFPERAADVRVAPFFLPHLDAMLDAERVPGDRVRFLFVGTDAVRKGLPEAIKAWEALPEATRAKAEFRVVSAMRDGAVEIPPSVQHEGYVDAAERMRAADVFVLPTKSESFGFVFVEAMASGLAVLATDDPPRREILGDAGLYAPLGDVDALRDAMARLIEEPGLAAKMGEIGRQCARERFAPKPVAERYVEIWREAAEDR